MPQAPFSSQWDCLRVHGFKNLRLAFRIRADVCFVDLRRSALRMWGRQTRYFCPSSALLAIRNPSSGHDQ
jgi:hypothetical protein